MAGLNLNRLHDKMTFRKNWQIRAVDRSIPKPTQTATGSTQPTTEASTNPLNIGAIATYVIGGAALIIGLMFSFKLLKKSK